MLENDRVMVAQLLGINPATLPSWDAPISEPAEKITQEGAMASHADLTDEEFSLLLPHLPPEPRREGAVSNRNVLDGLLWSRAARRALTNMPGKYSSSPDLIRKRAERWAINGAWDNLRSALPALDLSERRNTELNSLCLAYGKRGERIRRDRRKAS